MSLPRHDRLACALLLTAAVVGCGGDFDPYNRLTSLRILGIQAEPAWLAQGVSTTLRAAVFTPHTDAVSYEWSWCPFRASTEAGFNCAVSEAELNAALAQGGASNLQVSYALGNAASATFSAPLPTELLAAICAGAIQGTGLFVPNCVDGFPISIGLTVRAGGDTVVAMKEVIVQLDVLRPVNENPRITELRVGPAGARVEESTLLADDATSASVTLSEEVELYATVPETAAERYLPRPDASTPEPTERLETLTLSWFIEVGDTKSMRTSFVWGESKFDDLEHNTWSLPEPESTPETSARLWLVLRDNRGGTSWLTRAVTLLQP